MAFLTGSIGVLMAVPFLAVVPVLVKMFYVEDVLGERVVLPGQAEGTS